MRCTSQIGRLLARLVPVLGLEGGPEAAALTTLALEVATVLVNPDCCLNPQSSASARAVADCPALSEVMRQRPSCACSASWIRLESSSIQCGLCVPVLSKLQQADWHNGGTGSSLRTVNDSHAPDSTLCTCFKSRPVPKSRVVIQ